MTCLFAWWSKMEKIIHTVNGIFNRAYIIASIKKANELVNEPVYGGYPAKAGYLEGLLKSIFNISDEELDIEQGKGRS